MWINHMWSQALQNTVQLLPMDNYGWRINGDILEIVWDSEENIKKVDDQISYFLEGCGCSRSNCSRVCGCKRKERHCGPGCACSQESCEKQPQNELTSVQNSGYSTSDSSASAPEESDDEDSVSSNKEVLSSELEKRLML